MNQENFWDKKALDFPRYDEKNSEFQQKIITILEQNSMLDKNSHILDIGCGTGVYTLALAKKAKKITALDISSSMLNILKDDAKKLHVEDKIQTLHSPWNECRLKKEYDLIFASLSAAFNSVDDYEKLNSCSKKYVCFLDFIDSHGINFEEILHQEYGINKRSFDDCKNLTNWLTSKNIDFKSVPLQNKTTRAISPKLAIDKIKQLTKNSHINISDSEILELLKPITIEDKINYIVDMKLMLVYWEV